MKARALLIALIGSLALLPMQTRAANPEFYGINGQRIWSAPRVDSTTVIASLSQAGVKYVRINADWLYYEQTPPTNGVHHYNWNQLDLRVKALAAAGIRLEPMISHAPYWAQDGNPDKAHELPNVRPSQAHMADWDAYVQALIDRYGQNGTLWSDNPSLPKLPFQVYEVFNEQNAANGANWSGTVSHTDWLNNTTAPTEYASFFRRTYSLIKANDANAKVIVGGLTGGPSSMGYDLWMQRMMAADPSLPMDGVAIHPYASNLADVYTIISQFRTILNNIPHQSNGSASPANAAPIYITEIGWTTGYPNDILNFDNNGFTPPGPLSQEVTRGNDLYDLTTNLTPTSSYKVMQLIPHTAVTDEGTDGAGGKVVGDSSNDGAVTLTDLTGVLANFGAGADKPMVRPYTRGDTNGDKNVNLSDLTAVLSHFGDGVGNKINREQWMGLWDLDGTPKPSAQRYAQGIQDHPH